jgi:hypothetical protein
MKRHGYSIFCDDIRNEVGGKLSFIGCYNAVMFVPSQFPCLLPKFCVHFFMLSPAGFASNLLAWIDVKAVADREAMLPVGLTVCACARRDDRAACETKASFD